MPIGSPNGKRTPQAHGHLFNSTEFDEAARTLRESILLADLEHRPRSILVTSSRPREGKTTTAAYLAIAHSRHGRRTLLIDADLRRPGRAQAP